jgi:photosystem II stability/assembly factor-like uncharacterized protein
MNKIIYLLLFVFITSTSFAQWVNISNGLGAARIYSVAVNGNNLIAGTEGKGVYLSKDLGNNWESIGLSSFIIGCVAFNGNTILAGTEGLGIFISSDNGKNWNNPLPFYMINCITLGNSKIFAGSFNGLYFSTDNGTNWTKSNKMNSSIGNIITIGNTVIASTAVGIYISTDNGDNWVKNTGGLDGGEYFALAKGDNKIYTSSGGKIFVSIDNGSSWTKKSDVKADMIFTLSALGNHVFAGTLRENVFLSTDNGNNWVKKDNGLTGRTVKSLVISGENIFAGTDAGVFRAKLSDMISTDVSGNQDKDIKFLISPNPSQDFIDISIINDDYNFLNHSSTLQIFNTLGECVMTESIHPMSLSHRMNVEHLPVGLYFVRVSNQTAMFVKM